MASNDLINNKDLFDSLRRKPKFAWPTIILFLICAGFILGSTWAAIYGHISYLAACLINGTAGYFMFSPMHDAIHASVGKSKISIFGSGVSHFCTSLHLWRLN